MILSTTVFLMVFAKTMAWAGRSAKSEPPCNVEISVDITDGVPKDKAIYHNGVKYEEHQHYFDNTTATERGCVCMNNNCARKCCPIGFGYLPSKKKCVEINEVFNPPVWNEYYLMEGLNVSDHFILVHSVVNCSATKNSIRVRASKLLQPFHLRTDGQLYTEAPNEIPSWHLRPVQQYCIDIFVNEDAAGVRTTTYDALICASTQEDSRYPYLYTATCMLVSSAFMLVTVTVYLCLPQLHSLHGRVLTSYLLCLMVGFILLALMQMSIYFNISTSNLCVIFAFIIYFSLLSSFFWLNVMSYDIWRTFSKSHRISFRNRTPRGRFIAYAVYAFGGPTLLTVTMAGLEFSGLPLHPLLPGLRHFGCFLYGHRKLLYFYGPIVLLCMANIVFFALTVTGLVLAARQTDMLHSNDSRRHDSQRRDSQRRDKERLLLYIKLFALMGISWILEVISSLFPDLSNVWYITDTYNLLIGVIIFITFVCKKNILRHIKKRILVCHHEENGAATVVHEDRNTTEWKPENGHQRDSLETVKTNLEEDCDNFNDTRV